MTLTVPASGSYAWHVNPSTRPVAPLRSEAFTLTCETADGTVLQTARVVADRGEQLTTDLGCAPGGPAVATPVLGAPAGVGGGGEVGNVSGGGSAGARRLVVSRPAFSARRAKRTGGTSVRLRVVGPGRLTQVVVRITDARSRTLLRARVTSLRGTRSVRLKPVGPRVRLRPGRARVVVTAQDAGTVLRVVKVTRLTR